MMGQQGRDASRRWHLHLQVWFGDYGAVAVRENTEIPAGLAQYLRGM